LLTRSGTSNAYLEERTVAKRKLTKAERAEMEARHERMLANAQRLRELAEKAQARLDAERSRGRHTA